MGAEGSAASTTTSPYTPVLKATSEGAKATERQSYLPQRHAAHGAGETEGRVRARPPSSHTAAALMRMSSTSTSTSSSSTLLAAQTDIDMATSSTKGNDGNKSDARGRLNDDGSDGISDDSEDEDDDDDGPPAPASADFARTQALLQEFEIGRFSDVSVSCLGRIFKLHRIILIQSPFFRSLLLSGIQCSIVVLRTDMDPRISSTGLEFALRDLYQLSGASRRRLPLTATNAVSVLAAAAFLELEDLAERCVRAIASMMQDFDAIVHIAAQLDALDTSNGPEPATYGPRHRYTALLKKYHAELSSFCLARLCRIVSLFSIKLGGLAEASSISLRSGGGDVGSGSGSSRAERNRLVPISSSAVLGIPTDRKGEDSNDEEEDGVNNAGSGTSNKNSVNPKSKAVHSAVTTRPSQPASPTSLVDFLARLPMTWIKRLIECDWLCVASEFDRYAIMKQLLHLKGASSSSPQYSTAAAAGTPYASTVAATPRTSFQETPLSRSRTASADSNSLMTTPDVNGDTGSDMAASDIPKADTWSIASDIRSPDSAAPTPRGPVSNVAGMLSSLFGGILGQSKKRKMDEVYKEEEEDEEDDDDDEEGKDSMEGDDDDQITKDDGKGDRNNVVSDSNLIDSSNASRMPGLQRSETMQDFEGRWDRKKGKASFGTEHNHGQSMLPRSSSSSSSTSLQRRAGVLAERRYQSPSTTGSKSPDVVELVRGRKIRQVKSRMGSRAALIPFMTSATSFRGTQTALSSPQGHPDALVRHIFESSIVYTYMNFLQLDTVKRDGIVPTNIVLESHWLQAEMSNESSALSMSLRSSTTSTVSQHRSLPVFRFGARFDSVSEKIATHVHLNTTTRKHGNGAGEGGKRAGGGQSSNGGGSNSNNVDDDIDEDGDQPTSRSFAMYSVPVVCAGTQYRLVLSFEPNLDDNGNILGDGTRPSGLDTTSRSSVDTIQGENETGIKQGIKALLQRSRPMPSASGGVGADDRRMPPSQTPAPSQPPVSYKIYAFDHREDMMSAAGVGMVRGNASTTSHKSILGDGHMFEPVTVCDKTGNGYAWSIPAVVSANRRHVRRGQTVDGVRHVPEPLYDSVWLVAVVEF